MKFKFILSICFFLFVANTLLAQTEEKPLDIVYLKNGGVLKGKILEYTSGETIRLQSTDDRIFVIKEKHIKKIIQGGMEEEEEVQLARIQKPYRFKEKGFYNVTSLSMQIGGSAFNANEMNGGVGISTIFGYKFHRLLGAGVGVGMDYYYLGSGENFMPVFGEVRGYLFPKNITPTYSLAAGYGFAFADEERNIEEATGGLMIHPAVGFRFGGARTMNFTLDAGVKIQKGTFVFQQWDTTTVNRMTYKRLVIRAGVTF